MAKKKTVVEEITSLSDKDKALQLVKERFNNSKNFTKGYFANFQEYYKLYRSYLDEGRLPWRSNLFIPKTFEIVETVAPRIAQAQRTFRAYPVEGTDTNAAEAFTDLLKFQFSKTKMEGIIEELVKETLIYGTGVVKVTWGADDFPNPEVVDIFDFFPDPKARNLSEAKYCIHRVERDIEDLEENPNYSKDAIEKLKQAKGNSEANEERKFREAITGSSSSDGSRKRCEVLEYWGNFNGKEYLIVVAGDEILRMDENPYACGNPFVVVYDHKVPHEFYGIGEVEPIESLQNELNDVRNQRMDNVKLNLNNMWKVLPGGVQSEHDLISRPGGVIHMTRPDGVLPLEKNPIDPSAFTEEAIIKSDAERATGANSPISGALVSPMGGTQGGAINRTATGFQGAINQADKRFFSKINQIKMGIVAIGEKFLKLDQQFMDKEQVVRIVGEDGMAINVPVYPDDIKGGFDLEIDVEYMDDFQKAQQNIGLLQFATQVPGFDVPRFISEQILAKTGVKNWKEYILPPQPEKPEESKINMSLSGEIMPDAVAQILDKRENIKSHPDVVAAKMREAKAGEMEKQAQIANELSQQNATQEGEV